MPNKQKHRGAQTNDKRLFRKRDIPLLRDAVADLSWLLSKGYAEKSAKKVVGDRYKLRERQRKAVQRAACADASLKYRKEHELTIHDIRGGSLSIDGYNLLIGVECALSGAYLFKCRDGCIRDIASIHGSYRRVEETLPALTLIGKTLEELGAEKVNWFFDAPVSNSGRLKTLLYELAEAHEWNWDVELSNNPDKILAASHDIVISNDGWVLDKTGKWVNLLRYLVEMNPELNNVIDLTAF